MSDVAGYLGSQVDESNPWEDRSARIDEVVSAADDMAVKNVIYEMAKRLPRNIVTEGDAARRSRLVFGFALDSYVHAVAKEYADDAIQRADEVADNSANDLITAIGEHTHDA